MCDQKQLVTKRVPQIGGITQRKGGRNKIALEHPAYDSVLEKKRISPEDTLQILLKGNQNFQNVISESNIDLRKLSKRKLEEAWWICSDARAALCIGMDTHLNLSVAIIYSAGTRISFKYLASNRINSDVIASLEASQGDSHKQIKIKVQNHTNCKMSAEREVLNLLEWTKENGHARINFSECYFDWTDADPIYSTDATSNLMRTLFAERKKAGLIDLENLNTPYAHSLIISSVNDMKDTLPIDPRSVFGIERGNEADVVTANANIDTDCLGFDPVIFGSITHSLETSKPNIIALLNSNEETLATWKKELEIWFRELKKGSTAREIELSDRYHYGDVQIHPFIFDMTDGSAKLLIK
ncbi:MAG: hypothetical protein WC501_01175 [Candidatus Micrarchaeia archaeon]